jgi:hypothetical protein
MIRRVKVQPEQLKGFEYAHEAYEWFELVGPDGEVYAVCGLAFRGEGNREAWLYWRILGFSTGALKELRRKDVPAMNAYCLDHGAGVMLVASEDPADVDFEKMVGFMGFTVKRVCREDRLVMVGYKFLEACNVR